MTIIKNSAEFYGVTDGMINYFVNIPAGSQVQVYIADSNDNEWWSDVVSFSTLVQFRSLLWSTRAAAESHRYPARLFLF
jgi:hypothetical protein